MSYNGAECVAESGGVERVGIEGGDESAKIVTRDRREGA